MPYPIPEVKTPPVVTLTSSDVKTLSLNEEPKTIEIVLVESEYVLGLKAQAEKNKTDHPILTSIAKCESGLNYTAQNRYSTASGAFQVINGTWSGFMGYPTAKDAPDYVQWLKADELYHSRGTQPWNASKHCWSPNLTVNSAVYEIVGRDTQYNNCVSYMKSQTGITGSVGAGARLAINSQTPVVGRGGSLRGRAHAVVVERVEGDQIIFRESNFRKGYITRRKLPRSAFLGFIV